MRPLLVLILLALALASPARAAALWQSDGIPVTIALGAQTNPLITSDGAGGAFIAWVDYRGLSPPDVSVQHITAAGEKAAGWVVDGVPVCSAANDQYVSSLLADGAGGVFLVWDDYRTRFGTPFQFDVYAHHVLAGGTVDPNWPVDGLPVATGPADQRNARLAPDGQGGIFVAWGDERNGGPGTADLYLQHVTAAGTLAAGWPVNGKGICIEPGEQSFPALIPDGLGGVFVGWGDSRNSSTTSADIYALRLTADGDPAPGWTANGNLICSAPGVQGIVEIATDANGGIFLGWHDLRTAPAIDRFNDRYADIYAQRVTGAGTLAPGWPSDGFPVCTATNTQQDMSLTADGSGGVLLTWSDYRTPPSAVYVQRVTGAGTLAPGWPVDGQLASTAPGYGLGPRVAADGIGGAYLGFEVLTDTYRVWAQHLTGVGALSPGWPAEGIRMALTPSGQLHPSIIADGMGGAIIAWDDARKPSRVPDIYAQQLAPTGPTAIAISLASATAEPGLVRLTWLAEQGAGLTASVERRTESSDWQRLASVFPDGTGRILYEDHDVTAGSRYAYRLAYDPGDGVSYTAETWVSVPALEFALRGLTPNPSLGDPVVSFSLAVATPAMIQVYDIAGRLVASREVDGFGVGVHTLRLSESSRLPAGVYTVRLRQGERLASARAVVIR